MAINVYEYGGEGKLIDVSIQLGMSRRNAHVYKTKTGI